MATAPTTDRRLVFGLDVPCHACKGRGTAHTRHRCRGGEWYPCDHTCPACKGAGIVRR